MRIEIDFDLCESNAVCVDIAPQVFEVRDDDYLYLLQVSPPDDLRPAVEDAARSCPKQAITIHDD
ncbi:MAG: ferredoxin [Acidimicrobiia bacterium]|nr:ferredoxin [Acidimicrobiia bacterium]